LGGLFLYLAIVKNFEPLLLLPIGFGIFIVNFPLVPLMGFSERHPELLRVFYKYGLQWEVIPCVIFPGVSAGVTMHAMGPNLAGVIGSAAAAGMFIAMFD
jgi:carboxybiotin decarboxylase